MSIDRIFYCDAAECERHVQTASSRPQGGFFTVTGSCWKPHHFCSWDCILKFAAAQEPMEIIPFHDAGSGDG